MTCRCQATGLLSATVIVASAVLAGWQLYRTLKSVADKQECSTAVTPMVLAVAPLASVPNSPEGADWKNRVYKDGDWFSERDAEWPGHSLNLKIAKVLFQGKSHFQDILVFFSYRWGRVLALDNCIQCTEYDEFSYQEMLAHVPMQAYPGSASRVLIIGGGDGGVAREILKYACVVRVTMVEIDGLVIECAKKHLPHMSSSFSDPRLRVKVGDGVAFAQTADTASYDVVVVDSSDPDGPAGGLFTQDFYKNVARILTPNGVCVCQGESPWMHQALIKELTSITKKYFQCVKYGIIQVPTYPGGSIGMLCLAKDLANPAIPQDQTECPAKLKYYSKEVHRAAFILPNFLKDNVVE